MEKAVKARNQLWNLGASEYRSHNTESSATLVILSMLKSVSLHILSGLYRHLLFPCGLWLGLSACDSFRFAELSSAINV